MNTSSVTVKPRSSLGILDGIFLVFLAGKLYGFLDWSWWLVFSPYLLFLLIAVVVAVVGVGARG